MKIKEYEEFVDKSSKPEVDLNYLVIAVNEEAGEIAGWYKKAVLREKKVGLTDDDLMSELGDLQFYLTKLAHLKGWTLKDVMRFNVEKLVARRKERDAKPTKEVQ